jgi:hypothetical protein
VLEDDRNFLVRQLKASQEKAEQARIEASKVKPEVNKSGSTPGSVKGLNTVELLKSLRKTINESNDHPQGNKTSGSLPPIGGESPRVNLLPPGEDMGLSNKSMSKKKEVESVQKAIASDRKQLELMAREVQIYIYIHLIMHTEDLKKECDLNLLYFPFFFFLCVFIYLMCKYTFICVLVTLLEQVALVQRRRQANWLEALLVDCIHRVGDQINDRRQRNEDFGASQVFDMNSNKLCDVFSMLCTYIRILLPYK